MTRKKLTRKEIQEDRIHSVLSEFYDWLSVNGLYVAGVLGAVVLVVAGVYGWRAYSSSQTDQLQQSFGKALETYHAPLKSELSSSPIEQQNPDQISFETAEERLAAALKAFSELSDQSRGTSVGEFAAYYQAIIEADQGKIDEAQEALTDLAASADEPEVQTLTRLRLAQIFQQKGDLEAAVQEWKLITEKPSPYFPVDSVLLQLAEAYSSMGRKEDALAEYKRIVADYPTTEKLREIQSRIQLLEAQLGKDEAEEETPGA